MFPHDVWPHCCWCSVEPCITKCHDCWAPRLLWTESLMEERAVVPAPHPHWGWAGPPADTCQSWPMWTRVPRSSVFLQWLPLRLDSCCSFTGESVSASLVLDSLQTCLQCQLLQESFLTLPLRAAADSPKNQPEASHEPLMLEMPLSYLMIVFWVHCLDSFLLSPSTHSGRDNIDIWA